MKVKTRSLFAQNGKQMLYKMDSLCTRHFDLFLTAKKRQIDLFLTAEKRQIDLFLTARIREIDCFVLAGWKCDV